MSACLLALTCSFFFFNDAATTEIYTLSLHDALPICYASDWFNAGGFPPGTFKNTEQTVNPMQAADRKSTRLNSSHGYISYAVFCLKKKTHYTTLTATYYTDYLSTRFCIPDPCAAPIA